jgi:hypothetical protein
METYIQMLSMYQFVTGIFSSILTRLTSPFQPLNVYKVIKYSINDSEDKTDLFLNGCIIPFSETEYLEFRVKWLKTKYRFIVSASQPNYPSFVHFTKLKKSIWIIKAILINPDDNVSEDVLTRVLKFYGPNLNTFDNLTLTVDQMFKTDELKDTMRLMILTSLGDVLTFQPCDVFNLKYKKG